MKKTKAIFCSKFVNEDTYAKNGQTVEVLEYIGDFHVKIRFKDGTICDVYRAELKPYIQP